MTTKYSSPRSTRMAKWPSTIRRVELEQDPQVAVVGRPADRDQREEGPALRRRSRPGRRRRPACGRAARGRSAASRGWTGRRRSPSARRSRGSGARRRGRRARGPRRSRAPRPRPRRRPATAPSGSPQPTQKRSDAVVRQRAAGTDDHDRRHESKPASHRRARTGPCQESPVGGSTLAASLTSSTSRVEISSSNAGRIAFIVLSGPTILRK